MISISAVFEKIKDMGHKKLQATTMRTLFLLLYATGLRISEALSLTLADVQLEESLLLIRDSKFYKTRWVRTGPHLILQLKAPELETDS